MSTDVASADPVTEDSEPRLPDDAPNLAYRTKSRGRELAETIRDIVNPDAEIAWDATKPDGTPRKLLDTSRLTALGWSPAIELRDGIESTYRWFLERVGTDELRGFEALAEHA